METSPIISRMSIRGHPIHPMVIHFPVALLLSLVATDLAYLWTGDNFWARGSLWLAGIGALGGWVSGLVGMVDLLVVPRVRHLITAWCHAIMAVMLLSLASLNWLLRVEEMAAMIMPWGLLVSLLSALMIAITSYFGGQLVYEHAVGVDLEEAARHHRRFTESTARLRLPAPD
ncbi:MAG: DUF2231 domain-containing protein [Halomonadaceae bacterium]|nr:MAG: DUF2231 domain-containing protein [Halomonadaceae bacterium]